MTGPASSVRKKAASALLTAYKSGELEQITTSSPPDGATAAEDLELRVGATVPGAPGSVEAYVGRWSPRVRLRLPVVEGPGTLSIVCIDETGNRSAPSDIEYVLDTSAPPVGPSTSLVTVTPKQRGTTGQKVRMPTGPGLVDSLRKTSVTTVVAFPILALSGRALLLDEPPSCGGGSPHTPTNKHHEPNAVARWLKNGA